ncbi:MAG: helix-turn-helix domain-containing protein [bacterium]|nr:helix-turn-helix domain-containing protein [bacterium]
MYNTVELMVRQAPPEVIGTLTVADIAHKFNVNRSYLSRIFSKYNWFTLSEYIEMYKFYKFNSLVISLEKKTVKEAHATMRIKNSSHFAKRYRLQYDCNPEQYCKKWRDHKRQWLKEWEKMTKQSARKRAGKAALTAKKKGSK